MKKKALHDLKKATESAQHIVLILHVSPDGDTCGSALALRRAFILLGKSVSIVCDDAVPQIYEDLEGAAYVVPPEAIAEDAVFDLAIAVDVGDEGRLGRSARVFHSARHSAQIDHHETNPGYAEINLLRSPLSATGVLAADLLKALAVPLDLPIARCLYVAIATDTGNFKQQNTDPQALQLAARCIRAGVAPQTVTRKVFDLRPPCQTKLLGRALLSMQFFCDGRVSIMQLTQADFQESGALPEHTEGIVSFGINTEGVEIACLLSEQKNGIKCSLRSLPPFDVSRVATSFGGGGHALASGCTLSTSLEKGVAEMENALRREWARAK